MFEAIKNFAKVTVSTGYDNNDTAIVLAGGEGAKLPDPATDGEFRLVWWNATDYGDPSDDPDAEIVLVTAISTDTLTVIRGYDGTVGSAKNIATKSYRMALAVFKDTADRWASDNGIRKARKAGLGTSDSHGVSMFSAGRTRFALDVHGNIVMATTMDDIADARSNGSFDTTAVTSDSRGGVTFNAEGTKMYVVADNDIYQYSLSTPWDVTTASYDSVTAVLTGNDRHSPRFNPEGTILLLVDDANNRMEEYTLSTPWDLSTLAAGNTMAVSGSPTGMDVSPDGKHFYVCHDGVGGDGVYQYDMTIPWDITSAIERHFLSVSSNNPEGCCFNPSGTRFYVLSDFAPEGIMEFVLTKPYDLSTGSHVQDFTLPGNLQDDIFFSPHGHRIYIREVSTGTVVQYDLYDGAYIKSTQTTQEIGARISGTDRYLRVDASGNIILSGANVSMSDTTFSFLSVLSATATQLSFLPASSADDIVAKFGATTNVRTYVNFYRNNAVYGNISSHNSMFAFGYSTNIANMLINQSGRVQIAHTTNRGTNTGYLLISPGTDHRNALSSTYLQLVGDNAGLDILQDAANTAPWLITRHSTGTIGTPAASASGNFLGGRLAYSYDTVAFNLVGRTAFNALATHSAAEWGTRYLIYVTAAGGVALNAAVDVRVGNVSFMDTLVTCPTSGHVVTHNTKDAFTSLASPNNLFQHHWYRQNTNGVGVGIGFNVSSTTDNVGAIILHRRVSSNSQGVLEFYTKNSTTGSVAPVLGMIIDQNQNVYLGSVAATTPGARLHIAGTTDTQSSINLRRFSADASGGFVAVYKSRGTEATPTTAVSSGDSVGSFRVTAHDGTSFAIYNGMIEWVAGENQGTSNRGVYCQIRTTRNAGTASQIRLIVGQNAITVRAQSAETISALEDTYQAGLSTTDATATVLLTIPVASGQLLILEMKTTARRTDVAGTFGGYRKLALFKNVAGTVTQVGTTTVDYSKEDDAGLDCDFNINGTNVEIKVTGIAAQTWAWRSTVIVNN